MPRFRVHRLVALEFGEVLAWYAGLSPLATENFALRFHAALERSRLHPTAHAPWRAPFRRIRLARFPYLLIFHTDSRQTSILARAHERREPERTFAMLAQRKRDLP